MKYKVLFFLFACFALVSCIDDDLMESCVDIEDIEVPDYLKNGYSLNLKVTLDRMGGTRAATTTMAELEEIENYINPEKFRVLFFDHEDKLLFESKSRWVKMLTSEDKENQKSAEWLVSVPLFTYGNDVYNEAENKEWPWETIKEALTSNPFKIAILANRHDYDWYPGFSNTGLGNVSGWIDNTGPHWTPDNFRDVTIFDLHHCQYDAIYHAKSDTQGYYDFIAKDYDKVEDGKANEYKNYRPQMGATSSWADWDFEQDCDWITEGIWDDNSGQKKWQKKPEKVGNTNYNEKGWVTINSSSKSNIITYTRRPIRRFRHPSQSHPIPMYGVQKFNKIENWSKGTPFNLSKFFVDGLHSDDQSEYVYKNISLLRSVVKLELLIPKDDDGKKPEVVALIYPNLYARCEPMDVWTPTDELWDAQHPKSYDLMRNYKCQDTEALLNYGPVATTGNGKLDYQKKLSWFYGTWLEDKTGTSEDKKGNNPWWKFEPFGKENVVKATEKTPYPRIFNSYIQRNNVMICDDNVMFDDGNYWHYVVYTGERNILDPSDLGNMGNPNSGKPTLMHWVFEKGGLLYGLPITDYSNMNNMVYNYLDPQNKTYFISTDANYDFTPPDTDKDNHTKFMVIGGLDNMNGKNKGDGDDARYSQAVMDQNLDPDHRPWPLIRNHVYTLTLTTNDIPPYTHTWDFTKMSDDDGDIKNIVNASDWERDTSKDYNTYRNTVTINGKLKAGGVPIVAVEDLNFTSKEARGVNFEQVLDNNSTYCLRLDKQEKITFPKMKAGQTITIKVLYPVTAGSKGSRPLIISGDLEIESANDGNGGTPAKDGNGYYLISGDGKDENKVNRVHTLTWKAVKTTSVSLTVDASKGLSFTEFIIDEGSATTRTTRGTENGIGFKIKAQDLHSESIKFD